MVCSVLVKVRSAHMILEGKSEKRKENVVKRPMNGWQGNS
jgi:hypothetical protein